MAVWLNIGESFAHLLKKDLSEKWKSVSWFQPSTPLVNGIKSAIAQLEITEGEILVTSRLPQMILGKRIGAPIALVVTSGFEEWPRIRQPVSNLHLSLRAKRSRTLVDSELVFGISERTLPDGKIETPIDFEELEQLASKFELSNIKTVAIGLMHSGSNPENELKVKSFFESKGFSVVASHEVKSPGNEVSRWWRAYLNAYMNSSFEETIASLKEVEAETKLTFKFVDSLGETFESSPSQFFDTNFGFHGFLFDEKSSEAILYLGLENFSLIYPERETSPLNTEVGPVSVERKKAIDLVIQPTSLIETDLFGNGVVSSIVKGYEPGPICFGRGLNPLFIDLLACKKLDVGLAPLESLLKQGLCDKISKAVKTFFSGKIRDEEQDPVDFVLDTAISDIAGQIRATSIKRISVQGAFASSLIPLLKPKLQEHVEIIEVDNGII
jgi:hypothetical protein